MDSKIVMILFELIVGGIPRLQLREDVFGGLGIDQSTVLLALFSVGRVEVALQRCDDWADFGDEYRIGSNDSPACCVGGRKVVRRRDSGLVRRRADFVKGFCGSALFLLSTLEAFDDNILLVNTPPKAFAFALALHSVIVMLIVGSCEGFFVHRDFSVVGNCFALPLPIPCLVSGDGGVMGVFSSGRAILRYAFALLMVHFLSYEGSLPAAAKLDFVLDACMNRPGIRLWVRLISDCAG